MGGRQPSPPPPPPAPPSPAETARESILAQIETLPEQLRAEREFGPQFAEEQLRQLREFGPEFAEVGRDIVGIAAPEISEAQRGLQDFLRGTDEEEFERLRPGLIEDVRAGQSIRGIGDVSPLGAVNEAVEVQRLRESLRNRRLNVALSTAGRLPISQAGSPTVGRQGLLTQNVAPQDIFGAQSSINAFNANVFGTRANIFGTQSAAATARRGQNIGLAKAFIPDLGFNFGFGSQPS